MTRRGILTLALAAGLAALPGFAQAAGVRDEAKLFTPEAISKAEAILGKAEAASGVPVTVETVAKIDGNIGEVTKQRASAQKFEGIYILVTKGKLDILATHKYSGRIDATRRREIRDAFVNAARPESDASAGLIALAERASEVTRDVAKAGAPARERRGGMVAPGAAPRANGLATFFTWGAIILGVLLVIRLIGALLAPRRPAGYGPGAAGPGGGPAPGYGGPGGGGFLSGLAGGLGGALLGNWIYNSFGGHSAHAGEHPVDSGNTSGDWGGTGDNADDGGGDWGNTSGDWGGGDGGGDWGGGGGDW